MNYRAQDFRHLRTQLLWSIVFNRLLIATLSETKGPIDIGTSIIWISKELKGQVYKSLGKTSDFILANVSVSLDSVPAVIQHSYKDLPTFPARHNVTLKDSYIQYLQDLAVQVCKSYSLNASHLDKIFSDVPENFGALLATHNLTTKWWKSGIKGKIPKNLPQASDEQAFKEYHTALRQRLSSWKNFNNILMKLITEKKFKIINPSGTITISSASNHQVLIVSYLNSTNQFYSHIVDYQNLSPTTWQSEYDNPPQLLTIMGQR